MFVRRMFVFFLRRARGGMGFLGSRFIGLLGSSFGRELPVSFRRTFKRLYISKSRPRAGANYRGGYSFKDLVLMLQRDLNYKAGYFIRVPYLGRFLRKAICCSRKVAQGLHWGALVSGQLG